MGPKVNYLGGEVPKEDLIWQDPVPKNKIKLKSKDIEALKSKIAKSGAQRPKIRKSVQS